MWACVSALVLLMWMWGALSVHAVRALAQKTKAHRIQQRVYLGIFAGLGCAALWALVYWVLPHSVLSAGWTRELLEKTQGWALLFVAFTALLAFVRGCLVLTPARVISAAPVQKRAKRVGAA